MGADSGTSDDNVVESRADEKVFLVKNRFLIGFAGSFRLGQLLRFAFHPPLQKKSQDDYAYMCTHFVNAILECLKSGSFDSGDKNDVTATFLSIGYKGKIYTIDGDLQVGKLNDFYTAIGSARELALGSLYTTEKMLLTPQERILLALEAAAKYAPSIRAPFTCLGLTNKKNNSR
jgi:20S proteasome alpha/beta subunit